MKRALGRVIGARAFSVSAYLFLVERQIMNFIHEDEVGKEQVELKYCERCGGLFLREPSADVVYCAGCTTRMATEDWMEVTFPGDRRRLRPARLPKGPKTGERALQGTATIESMRGVATEEARPC